MCNGCNTWCKRSYDRACKFVNSIVCHIAAYDKKSSRDKFLSIVLDIWHKQGPKSPF